MVFITTSRFYIILMSIFNELNSITSSQALPPVTKRTIVTHKTVH